MPSDHPKPSDHHTQEDPIEAEVHPQHPPPSRDAEDTIESKGRGWRGGPRQWNRLIRGDDPASPLQGGERHAASSEDALDPLLELSGEALYEHLKRLAAHGRSRPPRSARPDNTSWTPDSSSVPPPVSEHPLQSSDKHGKKHSAHDTRGSERTGDDLHTASSPPQPDAPPPLSFTAASPGSTASPRRDAGAPRAPGKEPRAPDTHAAEKTAHGEPADERLSVGNLTPSPIRPTPDATMDERDDIQGRSKYVKKESVRKEDREGEDTKARAQENAHRGANASPGPTTSADDRRSDAASNVLHGILDAVARDRLPTPPPAPPRPSFKNVWETPSEEEAPLSPPTEDAPPMRRALDQRNHSSALSGTAPVTESIEGEDFTTPGTSDPGAVIALALMNNTSLTEEPWPDAPTIVADADLQALIRLDGAKETKGTDARPRKNTQGFRPSCDGWSDLLAPCADLSAIVHEKEWSPEDRATLRTVLKETAGLNIIRHEPISLRERTMTRREGDDPTIDELDTDEVGLDLLEAALREIEEKEEPFVVESATEVLVPDGGDIHISEPIEEIEAIGEDEDDSVSVVLGQLEGSTHASAITPDGWTPEASDEPVTVTGPSNDTPRAAADTPPSTIAAQEPSDDAGTNDGGSPGRVKTPPSASSDSGPAPARPIAHPPAEQAGSRNQARPGNAPPWWIPPPARSGTPSPRREKPRDPSFIEPVNTPPPPRSGSADAPPPSSTSGMNATRNRGRFSTNPQKAHVEERDMHRRARTTTQPPTQTAPEEMRPPPGRNMFSNPFALSSDALEGHRREVPRNAPPPVMEDSSKRLYDWPGSPRTPREGTTDPFPWHAFGEESERAGAPPTITISDRRASPRLLGLGGTVLYRPKGQVLSVELINLGMGGVLIRASCSKDIGSPIPIALELPGLPRIIRVMGEIIHVTPPTRGADDEQRLVGIAFRRFEPNAQGELVRLLGKLGY